MQLQRHQEYCTEELPDRREYPGGILVWRVTRQCVHPCMLKQEYTCSIEITCIQDCLVTCFRITRKFEEMGRQCYVNSDVNNRL